MVLTGMKTHFGIELQQAKTLIAHLQKAVATNYALAINTLSCHWNVDDPRFFPLHEMFQSQYEQLLEDGDKLAERIRQMGEKVPASLRIFSVNSELPSIDENMPADQMIMALASAREQIIHDFRKLSALAEDAHDYGLVDLLGGILRGHEKAVWMLRSHLR